MLCVELAIRYLEGKYSAPRKILEIVSHESTMPGQIARLLKAG